MNTDIDSVPYSRRQQRHASSGQREGVALRGAKGYPLQPVCLPCADAHRTQHKALLSDIDIECVGYYILHRPPTSLRARGPRALQTPFSLPALHYVAATSAGSRPSQYTREESGAYGVALQSWVARADNGSLQRIMHALLPSRPLVVASCSPRPLRRGTVGSIVCRFSNSLRTEDSCSTCRSAKGWRVRIVRTGGDARACDAP